MREDEKIHNITDDRKNIYKPVIVVTVILAVLISSFIWFGIKYPKVFSNMRDLTISLFAFVFFVISTVLGILFFYLSARIEDAKKEIDQAMNKADGKVEELGDKVSEILIKILEPVFDTTSKKAGILNIISMLKVKEK